MVKLIFIIFVALIQKCFCVSGTFSNTSWKCPSVLEVGTTCLCDEVKLTIHCNGATYQEMDRFFYELTSNNPDGVHVDLFRLENYTNGTLDVAIFTPCLSYTFCSTDRVELTFETMDFRGNKDLKSFGCRYARGMDITVKNLLVSNCSLSNFDSFAHYGILAFGSKLEHVDFSHNHMTELAAIGSWSFGSSDLDWPNLRTLNLSNNRITDVGYAWFKGMPNVDIIDLSQNYIQNIWNEAFTMGMPDPDKLDKEVIINLSNNKLSQTSKFYDTMFIKLKRPTKIILSYNEFNYLPQRAFQSFLNKRGDSIDISNNMLICDCQSEWLRAMALIYSNRILNYNCLNFNNMPILNVEKNLCDKY